MTFDKSKREIKFKGCYRKREIVTRDHEKKCIDRYKLEPLTSMIEERIMSIIGMQHIPVCSVLVVWTYHNRF
jgi:hypothetical protein